MRWIGRGIAALAVLVALVVGALLAVPTERVAALVTERLSAATGRAVTIEGDVRPTLWPSLGIRAEGLTIGNPDWVDAGPLLTAERLHVSVVWSALLGGEIRLDRAELSGPDIVLVRAADGTGSWSFGEPQAMAPGPGTNGTDGSRSAMAVGFDRAEISDGRVRWIDEAAGTEIEVTGIDAVLSLPSATARAAVEASADIAGSTIDVALGLDGIGPFLEGQVRNMRAELSWDGGQARFEGAASIAPALDGEIDIEASDLGPILALAGAAPPDLPEGLGRDRLAAVGRVTITDEGTAHLRNGMITLDGNSLAVELDVLQGADRPRVRGSISGGTLALTGLGVGGGGGDAASGSSVAGWPTDPIDVSGLFMADAELAVRLAGADLGAATIGAVEMNTSVQDGRLVLDIGRIEVYGGRLAGQAVVNGRGGLSVGGDLILAGVRLGPLLEEFADFDRLEGNGSASLQFLGVGNDMDTLMRSLEGQGDLSFGAGAILGLDLAGMIRSLDTSFRGEGARTVYDSIMANFVINDGVLDNDDLTLDAPWGGIRGEGRVDLGRREIDYRVIPGLLRDEAGAAGIEVPVLIEGPWSAPRFRPDLEALAEQNLSEQREQLEQGLRDRANDLLGTDIQAGDGRDDIEGALQERISEETQNVLSRLLGGGGSDETETENQ